MITTMRNCFRVSMIVLGQIVASIWKYVLLTFVLSTSPSMYIEIRRISRAYRSKYKILRTFRMSRSASIRVHVEAQNG